jgi:Excalibur calcium-binding domain
VKSSIFFRVFAAVVLTLNSTVASAQLHKCNSNGYVTYQNTPCQASEPRKQPTAEQLNAERRKKLAQITEKPAKQQVAPSDLSSKRTVPEDTGATDTHITVKPGQYPKPTTQPIQNFSCDGRKYCSQMTSCAEATFFLTNCPGVKMDGGSKNGVPCEQQWCNKH